MFVGYDPVQPVLKWSQIIFSALESHKPNFAKVCFSTKFCYYFEQSPRLLYTRLTDYLSKAACLFLNVLHIHWAGMDSKPDDTTSFSSRLSVEQSWNFQACLERLKMAFRPLKDCDFRSDYFKKQVLMG